MLGIKTALADDKAAVFCHSSGMIDFDRKLIAYAIIGLAIIIALPIIIAVRRKRHREKLRRRGIKTYGH